MDAESKEPAFRSPLYKTVGDAIQHASSVLPGHEEDDARWQPIVEIGFFIQTDPAPIWDFICRWGSHPDKDLRSAIATCLLEHLLEYHFKRYFPSVEKMVLSDPMFAQTFRMCWQFGQSSVPDNARRFESLQAGIKHEWKSHEERDAFIAELTKEFNSGAD